MSKVYETPSWAAVPKDIFFLEILKEGSIVGSIDLGAKDHFVMGRQPDITDICLDNPSISRMHAVLQFRDDGALMILDMGSQHGTRVNKQELKAGIYQRLYVGDILELGSSTRKYIVNGPDSQRPEELESENMKAYRRHLLKQSAKIAEMKNEVEREGISWGFREDAENDISDEEEETELPDYIKNDANYDRKYGEKYTSGLMDSEITEKDKPIIEKIKLRERKIQNMQEEIKRIYLKEGKQDEGLTEGQIAAVERNDKRIAVLQEQIDGLVEQVRMKNASRTGGVTSFGAAETVNKSSTIVKRVSEKEKFFEDDAPIDISNNYTEEDINNNWRLKKKLKSNSVVTPSTKGAAKNISSVWDSIKSDISDSTNVTYEELCRIRDKYDKLLNETKSKMSYYETRMIEMKEQLVNAEADDDNGLDSYLFISNKNECQESLKHLEHEEKLLLDKLNNINKLVKIAAPAIISNSLSTDKSRMESIATENQKTIKALSADTDTSEHNDTSAINVKETTKEVPFHEPIVNNLQSNKNVFNNIIENTVENSKESVTVNDNEQVENSVSMPAKRKNIVGPQFDTSINQTNHSSMRTEDQPQASKKTKNVVHNEFNLEGGEVKWVPPKNQSGDGKIALNAKYGY
jgi:ElaB/YqjD/DUF883 family membrane-anchored ribosome-binding protein/uncharacterized small protein (DUF1192 family)